MLKKLFYASASILLLAAGSTLPASAQLFWQFGPTVAGDFRTVIGSGVNGNPGSEIYGTRPAPGTVGEVAVLEAVLRPGDQVPLPIYTDGTSAGENEVFWTAHLWRAHFAEFSGIDTAPDYAEGDAFVGNFNGRTWTGGSAVIGLVSGNTPPDRNSPKTNDLEVLVTVVAVRSAAPTPAEQRTFGQVKVQYRK